MPNMSWTRLLLAALAGGIAASMTDWLFMGDWLYKRYDKYPEIWRVSAHNEVKAIFLASLLPLLTCAAFAVTCSWLHLHSFSAELLLAIAVWTIAVIPLTIANTLFMKLTPAIALSHAVGWFAKLAIAAAATAFIVR